MTMNNSIFDNFLKELPAIEAVLEWDGTEGSVEITEHESETSFFFIKTNLNVFESGTIEEGDHETPPSFSSNGVVVSEVSFNIYCKATDNEVFFTSKQEKQIVKDIIFNLTIIS